MGAFTELICGITNSFKCFKHTLKCIKCIFLIFIINPTNYETIAYFFHFGTSKVHFLMMLIMHGAAYQRGNFQTLLTLGRAKSVIFFFLLLSITHL